MTYGTLLKVSKKKNGYYGHVISFKSSISGHFSCFIFNGIRVKGGFLTVNVKSCMGRPENNMYMCI